MYWINIKKIGYISKISDIFDFFDLLEKIMIFPSLGFNEILLITLYALKIRHSSKQIGIASKCESDLQ